MAQGKHRAAPRRRHGLRALLTGSVVVAIALLAWVVLRDAPVSDAATTGADGARVDPDTPLAWGPTAGELARARELVAGWSPERLAGQVIVGRFHGTDPEVAASMVRDLHLAGVSVQSTNASDADQVRALTAAVSEAVASDGREFPPVIGVDQEGGVVEHLRGIATDLPSYDEAGEAIEAGRTRGRRLVRNLAEATGLELRGLGFTWVFAPVADVASSGVIGSRSPSDDPVVAEHAIAASVHGFNEVGIVSTTKHFPGHGAADGDSHLSLPSVAGTLAELRARDLRPFKRAVAAGAPAIMTSHLSIEAVDAGVPASLSPEVHELLARETGFEGVVITDSLGMGALSGHPEMAVEALLAGADLLLMPAVTEDAHAQLVRAIASGKLPRKRVEDAAAQVVALQLWQERVADGQPVPEDPAEAVEDAADALVDAG